MSVNGFCDVCGARTVSPRSVIMQVSGAKIVLTASPEEEINFCLAVYLSCSALVPFEIDANCEKDCVTVSLGKTKKRYCHNLQ